MPPALPLSTGALPEALALLGRDKATRDRIVALLKQFEASHHVPNNDIREEVTGPICDALHRDIGEITKVLASGLKISCRYTSKIIRDFVLSPDDRPDHVWEPQTTKTLVGLARSSTCVVVGGAYIGDHAILMAERMKANGGTCHCFEPSTESIELLRRNARDNGLTNLVFNRMGLWSEDGGALSLTGADSHAAPQPANSADPGAFPATSIDAYAKRHGIERIDIIMLDIEGGEIHALRGASRFLAMAPDKAPTVVFEVHRSYVDWSQGLENTEVVSLLRRHGYDVFAIRDYQGNVPMNGHAIELVKLDGIYLEGPPHGFNMIAVKRPEILATLGSRLCQGVSPKLLKHRDPKYHSPLS